MIECYHDFEQGFVLKDSDDNHVLAAAIAAAAPVIVTDNLGDFDSDILARFSVKAISSDCFIADTIDLDPFEALATIKAMREELRNPSLRSVEFIELLEKQG